MGVQARSPAERFWPKVDRRGQDECWPWTASVRPDGYGQFLGERKPGPAHAAAYQLERGPVPFRAFVRHSCGNKLCVNPAHLELETEESRFWSKVEKTEGCWNWTGAINSSGYGSFKRGTETVTASRVAFELCVGPVGDSYVCHHCDNRRCVRPAHLFLGDHKVNMADMIAKGRHPWQKKGLIRAATVAAACVLANAAAAGSPTTNFGWVKPAVGADADQWGTYINTDLDGIDSTVFSVSGVANAACPKAGCTFTGGITGTTASFSGASTFGSTLGVTGLLSAAGGEAITGNLTVSGQTTFSNSQGPIISAGTSASTSTYLIFKPTDFAAGKPELYAAGQGTPGNFTLSTFDGTTFAAGNLYLTFANVNVSGSLNTSGGLLVSANGANITGGLTLSGPLTLPAGSVASSFLATVNSSSGSCGSATTTCTFTTNPQGQITGQGSAPTHAAMSGSTAGALETNNGSSVSWSARASAYFSGCSTFGCTLAAGNGISGISRTGTGQYTVNISATFPNANYTVICTSGSYSGNGDAICTDTGSHGLGSVGIQVRTGGNNGIDPTNGLNILIIQN